MSPHLVEFISKAAADEIPVVVHALALHQAGKDEQARDVLVHESMKLAKVLAPRAVEAMESAILGVEK